MAQVYTYRFMVCHAGSSGDFPCPEGFRAVIRCCTAFNASDLLPEVAAVVHQPSNATVWQKLLLSTPDAPNGGYAVDDVRFAFDYGEYIEANIDSDIDLTVTGYLLTLP